MTETLEQPVRYPKYSGEYFKQRADELFEQSIKAQVEHLGPELHLFIDIESGDFAVGTDSTEPYEKLVAKNSNAQLFHRMVGREWTVSFGGRPIDPGDLRYRRVT